MTASPTLYRFESFAFTKLRSVYRQRTGLELDAQDFVSFGLVDEKGFLAHAGALLADESPMRFSRLICTRWNGLDKASGVMEALDDKEFSGSLIALLQGGEEFVRNNTKKRWKKTEYQNHQENIRKSVWGLQEHLKIRDMEMEWKMEQEAKLL